MKSFSYYLVVLILLLSSCSHSNRTISFDKINDNAKNNASVTAQALVQKLQNKSINEHIVVKFNEKRYDFYHERATEREYYISNHDQNNPKKIGFVLENVSNVTIDGQGAELVFHGRMIPFVLINCKNVTLKNFSIDFEIPALRQLTILEVNKEKDEVVAEIHPKGHHRISNNQLFAVGEGYENPLFQSMPFRKDRRLAYKRADVGFSASSIKEKEPNILTIKGWEQIKYTIVGDRFALRSYHRPTPGIVISECLNTTLNKVKVHYAEGMGLLAQMSENITLDGFSVCLKGDDDPRYFTTQADATHFSACKGIITSKNGLYEGMADDAINVHGTYLKVTKRIDDHTLKGRYMHPQAWGFKWGEVGDTVQFVESEKMELVGEHINTIKSIQATDKATEFGAKEFKIVFAKELPNEISEKGKYGIENLTWTPEVIFSNNLIRNNRARGSLFSTPKKVICENNVFDHTHGTAILLCGDCNGWFETGACREVIIRNNRFINALTSYYQFTNAIISIYPEIPNLKEQQKYFHSGVIIENNTFETFDQPILYAKSTDGLIFRDNRITKSTEFEPFHWNKYKFFFERAKNITLENNTFEGGFDKEKDVRVDLSETNTIVY